MKFLTENAHVNGSSIYCSDQPGKYREQRAVSSCRDRHNLIKFFEKEKFWEICLFTINYPPSAVLLVQGQGQRGHAYE